jgi:hypothetical protein
LKDNATEARNKRAGKPERRKALRYILQCSMALPNVQEGDATGDDSSNEACYQKA